MLQHADSLHAELNRLQARLEEINQEREHLEKDIEVLQKKLFEAITSVTTVTLPTTPTISALLTSSTSLCQEKNRTVSQPIPRTGRCISETVGKQKDRRQRLHPCLCK
jgi:predicted  nucleic acid-binding Zn-ribbon protein